MIDDDEWVRREVNRDCAANVRAGIGVWCNDDAAGDPDLGRPIYEYGDLRSSIVLHEKGL